MVFQAQQLPRALGMQLTRTCCAEKRAGHTRRSERELDHLVPRSLQRTQTKRQLPPRNPIELPFHEEPYRFPRTCLHLSANAFEGELEETFDVSEALNVLRGCNGDLVLDEIQNLSEEWFELIGLCQ